MQRSSLLAALLLVGLAVAGAQAPVECDGAVVKGVPSEATSYMVAVNASLVDAAQLATGTVSFAGIEFDVVSDRSDPVILRATMDGSAVTALAATPGVEYIECDGKAEAFQTAPVVQCNGFEMPVAAGRYMVTMKGDWSKEQLSQMSGEIAQLGADKGLSAADYFTPHNTVPLISMFSGTFSAAALSDLLANYGDEIDYIECDSMATIAKSKLYCMGRPIDAPIDAYLGYTISAVDSAAASAITQQMTEQGVTFEEPAVTKTGSVEVLSFLDAAGVDALMGEFGSSINFMKCEVARQPPLEGVGAGSSNTGVDEVVDQPSLAMPGVIRAEAGAVDTIDAEDASSATQLAARSFLAAALLLAALLAH